jgi:pimeloyl-ACP methyl ester carboxylesterase
LTPGIPIVVTFNLHGVATPATSPVESGRADLGGVVPPIGIDLVLVGTRDDPDGDWVDGGDLLDISSTEDALRQARDYGEVPLVVIRAERYEDVLDAALWREAQADLATLSSNAIHVEALGSGHFVMDDNPDAVVAAVAAVVEAARSEAHLPPCEDVVVTLRARCL